MNEALANAILAENEARKVYEATTQCWVGHPDAPEMTIALARAVFDCYVAPAQKRHPKYAELNRYCRWTLICPEDMAETIRWAAVFFYGGELATITPHATAGPGLVRLSGDGYSC